jgi:hypothetical protein
MVCVISDVSAIEHRRPRWDDNPAAASSAMSAETADGSWASPWRVCTSFAHGQRSTSPGPRLAIGNDVCIRPYRTNRPGAPGVACFDQLPGECRIDVQALPLQAAIGQQAVSALDTMLLFASLLMARPRCSTVSTAPCSAAITFTNSAVRRSLCMSGQIFRSSLSNTCPACIV